MDTPTLRPISSIMFLFFCENCNDLNNIDGYSIYASITDNEKFEIYNTPYKRMCRSCNRQLKIIAVLGRNAKQDFIKHFVRNTSFPNKHE